MRSSDEMHVVTITIKATTKAELKPGTFSEDWDCADEAEAKQLSRRLRDAVHRELDKWIASKSAANRAALKRPS